MAECAPSIELPLHQLNHILHPYPIEFQRRAEDEMAKMFHQVIVYAADEAKKRGIKLTFEGGEEGVIGYDSVDFRWQMKHFENENNREKYGTLLQVPDAKKFGNEISRLCNSLKVKTNEVVHKQELFVRTNKGALERPRPESHEDIHDIKEFLEKSIQLVDIIYKKFKRRIPSIQHNQDNIQSIHSTFNEICKYRKCYDDNLKMMLTPEQKEMCFQLIMKYLTTACREGEMHYDLVAVVFSAQCKIMIDEIEISSTTPINNKDESDLVGESFQTKIKAPLGPIRSVTDTLLGQEQYNMNPFCSSNMEMHRRLEDELAVFFRKLIKQKLDTHKLSENAPFRRPHKDKSKFQSTAEALGAEASFDIRQIVDHVHYYSDIYAQSKDETAQIIVQSHCDNLKEQVTKLAHKHHLQQRFTTGRHKTAPSGTPGTTKALLDFMKYGFNLARIIAEQQFIQSQELQNLKQTINEFKEYRCRLEKNSKKYYQKTTDTDQRLVAIVVLKKIKARQHYFKDLVVYEFSSRCNIKLSQLLQKPKELTPQINPWEQQTLKVPTQNEKPKEKLLVPVKIETMTEKEKPKEKPVQKKTTAMRKAKKESALKKPVTFEHPNPFYLLQTLDDNSD